MSSAWGKFIAFICPKIFQIPLTSVKLLTIREESVQELLFAPPASISSPWFPLGYHQQPRIVSFPQLRHPLPGSKNARELFHQIRDNIQALPRLFLWKKIVLASIWLRVSSSYLLLVERCIREVFEQCHSRALFGLITQTNVSFSLATSHQI